MRKIDFGLGFSCLKLPVNISKILIANNILQENNTYSNISGLQELKTEVINKFLKLHKKKYTQEQIIITNGARAAIFLYLNTLQPKIIHMLTPFWEGYKTLLNINSIQSKEYKSVFDISIEKDDEIQLICLINPGNPDGKIYSYDELKYILELLKHHPNLYVISDEVYSDLIYEKTPYLSLASIVDPELENKIYTVHSCSKSNEMSGWRVGFGISSKSIIEKVSKVQKAISANVCNFAQYIAIKALQSESTYLYKSILKYEQKRNLAISLLQKIFIINSPLSGMFILVNIDINSQLFCEFILKNYNVIIFPGENFGLIKTFRLCFARDDKDIKEGCYRIIEGYKKYKQIYV